MKFWKADYEWHGRHCTFEIKHYVVVGETREVALGLVLEAEPQTAPALWTITEIPDHLAEAHWISSERD